LKHGKEHVGEAGVKGEDSTSLVTTNKEHQENSNRDDLENRKGRLAGIEQSVAKCIADDVAPLAEIEVLGGKRRNEELERDQANKKPPASGLDFKCVFAEKTYRSLRACCRL